MCQPQNDRSPHDFSDAQTPFGMEAPAARRCGTSAGPLQATVSMVAQHVVARLVAGHAFRAPAGPAPSVADDEVQALVTSLLAADGGEVSQRVLEARRPGVTCEAICHDLLEPASRRLRAMWRDDECDYASFRLGQWRLRRLLHSVDHAAVCRRAAHRDPAAALVITLTDEEPAFEHALMAQYFARSGWSTQSHAANDALTHVLGHNRFHVAWIAIDEAARQQDVANWIRTIRRASLNRSIFVLCAGLGCDKLPAAWEVGADAMAEDARTALAMAERWRMWQAEDEGALMPHVNGHAYPLLGSASF